MFPSPLIFVREKGDLLYMENKDKVYSVKNRSGSRVVYTIPEEHIVRDFAPTETKRITYDELEKLTYQPGGSVLLSEYLQITDPEALDNLNIYPEQEYFMTKEDVVELLKNGSLDAFLDCLDFAPVGVLQLVKDLAVELRLNDVSKREAIKEKLGYDVDAAIRHNDEEKADTLIPDEGQKVRRVVKTEEPAMETPARRTTPKYNIVKTDK